eukprot:TRINITY_DN7454_c0_g1_i1.p1 TRINITY_DN7454_c0_g1~~TRINITY_DN7454_c0_g1_i1.p1  ORF type:complete len:384 (-),score=105.08 TRINITY_DN7454_c0_g1_i1:122-1273(-)
MSESDTEKQNSDWHNVQYKRRNNNNNNNNNSFSPPPGSRKDYKVNNNNGFKSERKIDSNNNNQKNGSSPTNNARSRAAPSPTHNFRKAQPGRKSNSAQNGSTKNQGIKINLRTSIDPQDYEKVRVIKSLVTGYSEEEIFRTLVENNKDVEQVIHQLQEKSKTKWSSVVQESIKGGLESSPNTRAVVSNYSAPENEEIPPPQKKTRAAKNNPVTPAAPKVSKTKQKKSKNVQQQYKKKAVASDENIISTDVSNENDLQISNPQHTEPSDPEPKKPDPKEEKMRLLQEELKAMAEKKELVRTIQKDLENYHATLLDTLRQNKMVLLGQKQDLEDQIQGLDRQIQTIDSKMENARDDISKFNSEKEQTLQALDSDQFFGEKSVETD